MFAGLTTDPDKLVFYKIIIYILCFLLVFIIIFAKLYQQYQSGKCQICEEIKRNNEMKQQNNEIDEQISEQNNEQNNDEYQGLEITEISKLPTKKYKRNQNNKICSICWKKYKGK